MDIYNVVNKDGDGKSGTIEYNPETKKIAINLDCPSSLKKTIQEVLTSEREFWIPESTQIDDYRIDIAAPVSSSDFFRMAMSELYGATGIYVLW